MENGNLNQVGSCVMTQKVTHYNLLHYSYTIVITVATVTCEYPLLNKSVDYSEQVVVGTNISFNCSEPGHVLAGPNTTTCTDDGQWVPDLSQLQMNCKGINSDAYIRLVSSCMQQYCRLYVQYTETLIANYPRFVI